MSAVDNWSDEIAVTVTPTQARHIATAIRVDLATQWEQDWLRPSARREEVSTARSLLDAYADELEMLHWGEPAGDVDLRSERKRLSELARNLLEGGVERVGIPDDASAGRTEVRRQGEDMIAAARAIRKALAHVTSCPPPSRRRAAASAQPAPQHHTLYTSPPTDSM